ncbi:GNAT family N-acetyltransferase [Breoghania sp.]|uniref:GNAT family N-acetyltransferase n=1 Tax=Breoghania sp. TaxID=2065378 RepID=UPI002AAAE6C7|nr:GNAT family N-acetyltransferase [Breoghania sp.]
MTEKPEHIIRVLSTLGDISAASWDRMANPHWTLHEGGRLESTHEAAPDRTASGSKITSPTGTLSDLDESDCKAGDSTREAAGSAPTPLESAHQEAESDPEETAFNPFISHAFLRTLEDAGCVSARTGWMPRHLVLEDSAGTPLATCPCYVKSHSQGEYVFDYGWADAFERAGGRYYPKLQVSVPFTPATGRRLLVSPDLDIETGRRILAAGLHELCAQLGTSSVHLTFLTKAEARLLERENFLLRTDRQFHWVNRDYASFDDFLSSLSSRKRKAVKRERREALQEGEITIEWLTGDAITEDHWDAFYAFYMDTGSRKWGRPYLNRTFFSLLGERLGERVLLVMAKREGRYIAGALNMIGSDTLYGRYWGCTEDHPFLHFEVCYHQAIDYAIRHGLSRVEAGAQGAHKLARGYLAHTTWSAHWIAHAGLRHAVEDFLEDERRAVAEEQELLNEHAPYKHR